MNGDGSAPSRGQKGDAAFIFFRASIPAVEIDYYAYSTIKAPDKGEVGGSSPPRPTIFLNHLDTRNQQIAKHMSAA